MPKQCHAKHKTEVERLAEGRGMEWCQIHKAESTALLAHKRVSHKPECRPGCQWRRCRTLFPSPLPEGGWGTTTLQARAGRKEETLRQVTKRQEKGVAGGGHLACLTAEADTCRKDFKAHIFNVGHCGVWVQEESWRTQKEES